MKKSKLLFLLIAISTVFLLAGDTTVPIFLLTYSLINKIEKKFSFDWLKNF